MSPPRGAATEDVPLPPLNARAWLRLPCCGAEHPTRVEDLTDGDVISVGTPIAPHSNEVDVEIANKGCFLGWVTSSTAMECAVEVTGTTTEPVPMWSLHPIEAPTPTQRRSYVRFSINLPIELHLLQSGAATHATTLDISEGGVRCTVDKWAADPSTRAFRLSFELDGTEHELTGQVAWWGPLDAMERREVGIRFIDPPQPSSDAIRKWVFAAQLEERRRLRG